MPGDASIVPTSLDGHGAYRLASPPLEALVVPELGLLGASLRHRGEELLGLVGELEAYAKQGSTLGIPLLHPWANRLEGFAYAASGLEVELDPASPLLHLDGNGLPIHGVPGAFLPWAVTATEAEHGRASLAARLDWGARPDLLAVFPFPHVLECRLELDSGGLTIATTLVSTGDRPVPVSFGYHPYLRIPGARDGWRVALPPMRRLVLDERMIPTGKEVRSAPFAGPLRGLDLDAGFTRLPSQPAFALEGSGRRIVVTFLDGYRYAQVFAPAGRDYVAFEPMTAPTDALVSGRGLTVVPSGGSYHAAFRISVDDL